MRVGDRNGGILLWFISNKPNPSSSHLRSLPDPLLFHFKHDGILLLAYFLNVDLLDVK